MAERVANRLRLGTGERIRILREIAHLSRAELAEWCRISVKSLSRYERGELVPPGDKLGLLATRLETTTDYLLGLTDDPDVHDPDPTSRVWLNPALVAA